MVYDIDKLMPAIKSWASGYPITSNTIEEFIKDRFISPELLDTNKEAEINMEYL
jgi:hypothetical protein